MQRPFRPVYLFSLFLSLLILSGCKGVEPKREASESSEISGGLRQSLLAKTVYEWSHEEKVIGFRNIEEIWDTRRIEAGEHTSNLPTQEHLALQEIQFDYQGNNYDLDAFIAHNQILGLLVIKNDTIVLERYAQGNTPQSKWISFSVAKSVVSLLMGAAVKDGYIESLDDPVSKYLPELAGSEYEKVSILQAMQMASGVRWNENYDDPQSDIRRYVPIRSPEGMLDYVKQLPRVAPPGERFNYNTAETRLVGLVLRAAIGDNLSPYLSSKIWKPFGMESDANWWLLSPGGPESGGCCISATLRDYGRLGLFTLSEQQNKQTERSVLPAGWMEETTSASPAADYYGALWWPAYKADSTSTYAAYGVFGQMIWVDPSENLVIATHSAWPQALGEGNENFHRYAAAFATAATMVLKE